MGFLDKLRGKKNKPEVTPGGSTIYRYGEQEDSPLQIPEDSGRYLEEVEAHFDSLFPGRESFVYHEIVSDLVHIDIHVMVPTEEQPFYVVYTTGMSDRPMSIPHEFSKEERKNLELSELYLFLPGDWVLGGPGKTAKDISPAHFWPIQMLKFLARFPHMYQTWLAYGHTLPNGPEYAPLDSSVGFGGAVINCGDGPLSTLTARDGRLLHLYQVIFAYKEEIEYKLKYGMEGLNQVFQEQDMSPILDPKRPNYCADFKEVLDG